MVLVDELGCEAGLNQSLQSNCLIFILEEVVAAMPDLSGMGCFHYSKLANKWKIKTSFQQGSSRNRVVFQQRTKVCKKEGWQEVGMRSLSILTDNFNNRMLGKRGKQTLQPIVNSISSRNIVHLTAKAKRSVSLRPILSCKVNPATIPTDMLPPIKRTLQIGKPRQECPRERRQSSKGNFDERIIGSKARQTRPVVNRGTKESSSGLSRQALFLRKESHLNTYFNQRKNKLKDITHENKRIYVKINSQKSLYSSSQLNKSHESNSDLSRRLSSSKLSRASSRSGKSVTGRKEVVKAKPKEIKIESLSINRVEDNQIHRYLNIFCNNANVRQASSQKVVPKELPPPIFFKLADKENKATRELGKLQQIVEELNERNRRKPALILGRLL